MKGRPIEQLFRCMGNLNRTVSVQMPSLSLENDSFITMLLCDVQDKFLKNMVSEDPLNVLDLCNPLPRSTLPKFLTGLYWGNCPQFCTGTVREPVWALFVLVDS